MVNKKSTIQLVLKDPKAKTVTDNPTPIMLSSTNNVDPEKDCLPLKPNALLNTLRTMMNMRIASRTKFNPLGDQGHRKSNVFDGNRFFTVPTLDRSMRRPASQK